jgi:hypothetical protein
MRKKPVKTGYERVPADNLCTSPLDKTGQRLRLRIGVFMNNAAAIWPGNDLSATADEANRKKCADRVAKFATMIASRLGTMITGR